MGKRYSIAEISKQLLESLSCVGNLGPHLEDGFTRPGWSHEESLAMNTVKELGMTLGLAARWDEVGNLYLSTRAWEESRIQIGSHLDTVPMGGLFDGGAGIVAGLAAINDLKDHWSSLTHALELVIWRGEESATFGSVCKGSRAAFGTNDPAILDKRFDGVRLEDAIRGQGYDPTPIRERRPALSPSLQSAIAAHLELHIEQARKLELDGLDIGVITSIRGTRRFLIEITGEAAHSGATPLGLPYRKDANLAMAHMLVRLDSLAAGVKDSADLVQTAGIINCDPDINPADRRLSENALTKVSPFAYFTFDVRSNSKVFLDEYCSKVLEVIRNTASEFAVGIETRVLTDMTPLESLDARIQEHAVQYCQEYGIRHCRMASGALHDVAVVAASGMPSALLFIPCRGGISHNPLEWTSVEAIAEGARVLSGVIRRICADRSFNAGRQAP